MSQTKNTIAPPKVQQPLLTEETPFSQLSAGVPESGLLMVASGKPSAAALNHASMLMAASIDFLARLSDGDANANELYGIRFLVETSAALVEASVLSVEFGSSQGGGQ